MSLTVTDLFCGAGGSGLGAHAAGFELVMAANHWQRAIDTHSANFPDTEHDCADISQVNPHRYRTTDVLLDQLAPGCEIVDHADTCPQAAAWIVWVTAPWLDDCPKTLACDQHRALFELHHATCEHCRGLSITFHAEPLR